MRHFACDFQFREPAPGHRVIYITSGAEVVAQLWLTGADRGLSMAERESETIATAQTILAALQESA